MTDDQWLDAALAAQAARSAVADPSSVDLIWDGVATALAERHRRRRRFRLGLGFAATFVIGLGVGTLVPAHFRPATAVVGSRGEEWRAKVLDAGVPLGDRTALLDQLGAGAPGTSLPELQGLYGTATDPVVRGAVLRTAMRLDPTPAIGWVWDQVADEQVPEITRLIGLAAVGPRVSAATLATLAGARTSMAVRYGVFEQLGKSADPESTDVLERLARVESEPAMKAAMEAALQHRRERGPEAVLRGLTGKSR